MAARRACIADDIEQMPMKMFTMLSDRAVTISGGQKQRLLIARAAGARAKARPLRLGDERAGQ